MQSCGETARIAHLFCPIDRKHHEPGEQHIFLCVAKTRRSAGLANGADSAVYHGHRFYRYRYGGALQRSRSRRRIFGRQFDVAFVLFGNRHQHGPGPITSQLHGANRVGHIGHQLRQSLWLCLINSVVLIMVLRQASYLFLWAGIDAHTAQIAGDYLLGLSWGIPPVIFYISLRYVLEGLGQTRPPMIIAASILPLNALLNYALIYGKFGLPELGGVGCGYATAIVFWVEFGFMSLFLRKPYFRATRFFAVFEWPQWHTIGKIFKLGFPIALTVFLEMALFGAIGFFVAKISITEMAAHSIASNLNWMTYVIPMGIGSAASIRIGFLIGAGNLDLARATAWAILKFAIGYALTVSVLLVAFRYQLVSVYTTDLAVTSVAVVLLLFIAVYQIVDDTQAVLVSALRGYKTQRCPC